ncbi:MAG TPA: GntR family transcriptional regulator [Candidatus Hydrogenedentes bacterium]|nr:GntR family transcriptional regulator [Candidatus Hydrogenedentota bacterium]HIJ72927.1 GntR family transcriptional regulator [Candidatus Hydrogenedentota bacterium]
MAKLKLNSRKKIKHEALTHQIYDLIKGEILDMRLKPGERLTIDTLAREMGVSISPVREALARIQAERLVERKPYAGYVVAQLPSKQYFIDMISTRALLECHAARIGAPRKSKTLIRGLVQALHGMNTHYLGTRYKDFRGYLTWDIKFHELLIRSTDNEVLVQIYEDLRSLNQLSRLYMYIGKQIDQERVHREHEAILEAYREGDGEKAAEAVRRHLESTRKNLECIDEPSLTMG